MVNCVRHSVLPRLKTDAGLPFFFRCITKFKSPFLRGFFFAQASGDNNG
ncbi:pyr operon leader peptide [Scandinavium sp. V105_16]|uniref:pyr operon leader peptide n=1 Tax=Scandinavium lactucae TaxID=3095028 RepID=A0AAJ2RZW2_9ENTR|nr:MULTISPECIES: pyr operon leader peptide [unclassified Scandinavium]MDX6021666.1 pyr operon leader peptide [Scandinavium sp. V105_16]MDX6031831.1 pyr operon leader peptide [Scandinavium sp. V105_12]MDX6049375.1 pyr operon leader peptide [Scandinavium sp. V105_1]